MTDLTKNTTAFGLLSDEDQEALKAWPHGVERFGPTGEWEREWAPPSAWMRHWAYRAIPAPDDLTKRESAALALALQSAMERIDHEAQQARGFGLDRTAGLHDSYKGLVGHITPAQALRDLYALEAALIEKAAQAAESVGRPVGAGDGNTYVPGTSADAAAAIRALGPGAASKVRVIDNETVWAVCPYVNGRHGDPCLQCPRTETHPKHGTVARACFGLAEEACGVVLANVKEAD